MPEMNLLAHEVGHYLQNRHPFVNGISTVSEASARIREALIAGTPTSEGLNALDGDRSWVLDTLPDCQSGIYDDDGIGRCDPAAPAIAIPVVHPPLGINETYYLQPEQRHNIMSYFKGCHDLGHWNTPQMIERIRDGLENGNRHRLLGKESPLANLTLDEQGQGIAGPIGEDFEIVRTRHGQLVTAIITASNTVKLIAWHVDDAGNVTRKGSIETSGTASELTAENLGLGLVATAFKNTTGQLKVVLWQVDELGYFVRKGDAQGTLPVVFFLDVDVESLSIARMDIEHLVTAVRSTGGGVYLVVWKVNASGEISRVSLTHIGAYQAVSLSQAGRGRQVFSSLITPGGNLRVIAWKLEGNQLIQSSQQDAEAVSSVESAYLDVDLLTTAVQVGGADLKLINWHLSETGVLSRLGNDFHLPITSVSATRLGVDLLGTAVVGLGNNLEVGLWRTNDAGFTIMNSDTETSIGALQVDTTQVSNGKLAIAVRDSSGNLRVMIWNVLRWVPVP